MVLSRLPTALGASLIGGSIYDGTSVEIVHSTHGTLSGVEDISFGQEMEFSKVKGTGQVDRGYTPGRLIAQDVTLTLWESEYNDLVVKSGGSRNFFRQQFDISITLKNDLDVPLKTILLAGCRPASVNTSYTTSNTGIITRQLVCQCLQVWEEGVAEATLGQALEVIRQVLPSPF